MRQRENREEPVMARSGKALVAGVQMELVPRIHAVLLLASRFEAKAEFPDEEGH